MKISKSKQELARIISENGGWREGAEWAVQNGDHGRISFSTNKPARHDATSWMAKGGFQFKIEVCKPLKNWYQTILSRAEYFHLSAPDADGWIEWSGGECPVDEDCMVVCKLASGKTWLGGRPTAARLMGWYHDGDETDIIAYRLHKLEQADPEFCESVMRSIPEPTAKLTIEQLAADYRNAKDYAERKQQDADDAKADADEKLRVLELAGEAIGLIVSPITENMASQKPHFRGDDW